MTGARSRLAVLGLIAAAAAAWVVLAPMQLGGATAYATIDGVSMEPHLHRGDLVLVHRADDYAVGDVVAYRSALLGRVVLHRIVAVRDGRYVFKGDNNDFLDPGTVPRDALIGRKWARVPRAGTAYSWLHTPWRSALVAAAAAILLLGGRREASTRRRRRGRDARRAAGPDLAPALAPATTWAAAAAAVFGVLALLGFALPATRAAATTDLYSYTGRFSYGATGRPSAAYPDGRVRSGDAVFTSLVSDVDFGFAWKLASAQPHAVGGTATLAAVVSDGGGWARTVPLAPARRFAGDAVAVRGRLHVDEIRALIGRFQDETGKEQASYIVTIAPRVTVRGSVGTRAIRDVYAPTLAMSLDGQELRPADSGDEAASLTRSQSQPGIVQTPNRLALAGHGIALSTARGLGIVGLLVSLLVLVAAAKAAARLRERDPVAAELARSGHSVVRIDEERRGARIVELRHLAGLIRVANRYDRLILHAESTGAYLVQDDEVVYRWRGPAAPAPPPERRDLSSRPWAERPARGEDAREAGAA